MNESIDNSTAIVTVNTTDICTQGLDGTELKANNMMVTGSGTSHVVCVEDLDDLDITVAKKEYAIVGDGIYIPQLYDDAPQWLKDLVQLVVDVSMESGSTQLISDLNNMLQEFAVSYVPLNQFTQSIINLTSVDERLNAMIETLNSNFSDGLSEANAQIIDLMMTKASKEEVLAQVIQTIATELANPNSNLGATVVRLEQAIATEQAARALSMNVLTASLEGLNEDIIANAEVVETALAYVGIDEAGASTGTGLSAYLEASNGVIGGADSQVANNVYVDDQGNARSKFEYNSLLVVNGVYRKSGFGLTSNIISGAGTQANPYSSEFWIDATKLRFTNSNMTGRNTPFTIDASGVVPQIRFDGVVEFSNVNGASQGVVNEVNNGQTTTINGGRITTGSVTANQIASKTITANQIATNSITADVLQAGTSGSTVWKGGGLVSNNFNGNPYGYIGAPNRGFRLSSDAAGSYNDPNIYGAYMRGGTINGGHIIAGTLEGTTLLVNDMYVRSEGSTSHFGKPIATFRDPDEYWYFTYPIQSTQYVKPSPVQLSPGDGAERIAPIYYISGKYYGDGFMRNRVCFDSITTVEIQLGRVSSADSTGDTNILLFINDNYIPVEGPPTVATGIATFSVSLPGSVFSPNLRNYMYLMSVGTNLEAMTTSRTIPPIKRITIFNQ